MPQISKLSEDERKATEELEMRLKNVIPAHLHEDKTIYYRFLKARDFDVDKAEKMLRKTVEWRKAFQVDTILTEIKDKQVYSEYMTITLIGHDKSGDIIAYSPIGKIESRDILRCMKMNDIIMHTVKFLEKVFTYLKYLQEETGSQAYQLSVVFDLEELTLSNTTSKASADLLLSLINIAQDNYPERLKSVILINAPSYSMIAFNICKSIMSAAMIRKFSVFSQTGWKEKLLEMVDEDVLPAFLGGNRTDPDGNPLCKTFIMHGGKTPPIYHLSEESRYFKDGSEVKTITIPPGSKKEIDVEVLENGSRIEWQFFIKSKDINFGLSLKLSERFTEDVLPIQKYYTPDGTQDGSYRCKIIGIYVIIFDNSYSWMSSKEVQYNITVKNGE